MYRTVCIPVDRGVAPTNRRHAFLRLMGEETSPLRGQILFPHSAPLEHRDLDASLIYRHVAPHED